MTIDSAVLLMAGCFVLLGCALTVFVHPLWILLPVCVGLNMAQASMTGFCPAARLMRKLGLKDGTAFHP